MSLVYDRLKKCSVFSYSRKTTGVMRTQPYSGGVGSLPPGSTSVYYSCAYLIKSLPDNYNLATFGISFPELGNFGEFNINNSLQYSNGIIYCNLNVYSNGNLISSSSGSYDTKGDFSLFFSERSSIEIHGYITETKSISMDIPADQYQTPK